MVDPKHKHSWKVWWESGTVKGRVCKTCNERERMSEAWCNKTHVAENLKFRRGK